MDIESINIILHGQFEYIKNTSDRIMLYTAYNAITNTESWEFIKDYQELDYTNNFIIIDKITQEIKRLGYNGHSGCSFMFTMRTMQYIAKYGEEKFKNNYV